MTNDELDDIIFNAVFGVFYKNNNWIEYGDLCVFTLAKVRTIDPDIPMDTVEKWIKNCIAAEYISVAQSQKDGIAANDYCRGEWLGLDKE